MIPVSQEQIQEFTDNGWWGKETVLDIVYKNAATTPHAEAIVDPYNRPDLIGDQPKRLTYEQMIQAIDRLAIHFEEMGVKRDDVILIQLPNVVDAVLVYLAAARIGAISSPLAMMVREHELEHALRLTDAVAIISVSQFAGFDHLKMMRGLQQGFKQLKHIILAGNIDDKDAISLEKMFTEPVETRYPADHLEGKQSGPNDVFTICWTSGTEADPKGVPRTSNHWTAISKIIVEVCDVPPQQNIHGTFPVINMAGFGGLMMLWVLTGGKFVLHHPFDLNVYLEQMKKEELYYTLLPPALLDTIAQSPLADDFGKTSIKVVASGSAPLSPWMVEFYQDKLDINIINFFASNEGTPFFSSYSVFPKPEDRATFFPKYNVEGSQLRIDKKLVGGIQTRLKNSGDGSVIEEKGVVGELCIKGPTIFGGYWERDDLTAKSFDEDGYYMSGDLFSMEGENMDKFLFHGRCKDLIIRGGQNISPEEVEGLVAAHPKIQEASAVGYPDSRLGERTCVCVVPMPEQTITLDEIIEFLDQKGIAKYKYPERLEVVQALPRNALNKVLRRELRTMVYEIVKGDESRN